MITDEEVNSIRKKFLRMLKENNILKAYINSFNRDYKYKLIYFDKTIKNFNNLFNNDRFDVLKRHVNCHRSDLLFNNAFLWEDTPEGHAFWKSMNDLWKYRLYLCKDEKKLRDFNTYIK